MCGDSGDSSASGNYYGSSQEFSPGDIDPVTNHTVDDVDDFGNITSREPNEDGSINQSAIDLMDRFLAHDQAKSVYGLAATFGSEYASMAQNVAGNNAGWGMAANVWSTAIGKKSFLENRDSIINGLAARFARDTRLNNGLFPTEDQIEAAHHETFSHFGLDVGSGKFWSAWGGDNPVVDWLFDWSKPIVLDLDGDGVEFVDLAESTAFFDIDNSGYQSHMGWVRPDDGFLAYDKDNDGAITSGDELSFIGYVEGAQTDLEGPVYFDTNQDGVFNSSDADWSKFGVWQDFDQDGTTDDGEFHSLDVVGINAISLTSDNSQRTYGSNVVHGFGSYSVVGGGTGTILLINPC